MNHPDTNTAMIDNNFAVYFAGDAYTTANKIMGRQSAGQSFMRGMARTWPQSTLSGFGLGQESALAMLKQLQGDGFGGKLRWIELAALAGLAEVGALYYPSPAAKDFAHARNLHNPAAFSFMGVTFTLSSHGATDMVASLILPPFKPWDAMICISECAKVFSQQLHAESRAWWSEQTGATRFNTPQMPVIPLGIDAPSFTPQPGEKAQARAALGLPDGETAFLFAGRLAFHAKANPAPVYQALEQIARQTPVACIEAGVFPNGGMRDAYLAAQKALAPSVRFVVVDGNDSGKYRQAWQGADVFVSLSDNIQETFGLTPVEAMAAGLPVVVSDWNGYKETVRDGIDGLRVPSTLPPPGMGGDLAFLHALGIDNYDYYIGRTSMATVVDPEALRLALARLATQPALRAEMGAAGQRRAHAEFDWPAILPQYAQLAEELGLMRAAAGPQAPEPWAARADPFARFAHFPSQTLGGSWKVRGQLDAMPRFNVLHGLAMASFSFHPTHLPKETVTDLLAALARQGEPSVNELLAAAGHATPVGVRALMWLWKFDLVKVRP